MQVVVREAFRQAEAYKGIHRFAPFHYSQGIVCSSLLGKKKRFCPDPKIVRFVWGVFFGSLRYCERCSA
jgi:hypothetical protein